jgi:hypothetical protein
MAFDPDLRELLQNIKKVSRRPFENLPVQAQKSAWDNGVEASPEPQPVVESEPSTDTIPGKS